MPSRVSRLLLIAALLLPLGGCTTLLVGGAVATGAVVAADRRSPGTLLDDKLIQITATDRIYADPLLGKRVHLKVASYDRVVLLTGEVPNEALHQRALNIVRETRAVRAVLDETRIAPPAPLNSRLRDRWIAAKIKASLAARGLNPLATRVVVDAGTVHLLGALSDEEADAVLTVARQVHGVRRVVVNNARRGPAPALARPEAPAPPPAPEEEPVEPAEPIPYDAAAFEAPVGDEADTPPPTAP